MSNLRQNMTDDEWNNPSSLPKIHYTRSEVKKIIREFADHMVVSDPETDEYIDNWIENKLKL